MRGTTEINIGGKLRPVKFGTNQSAKYCEIRALTLEESRAEFLNLFRYSDDGTEIIGSNETGGEIRDLIYSGLWAAVIETGKVEFNNFTVGNWIDDMDQSELNKVFDTLINSNNSGDNSKGGSEDPAKK